MSTFTDDFSSGSLAGYTGVADISPTPTGGPSGGTGIIATGTASQQYYGEITKVFAAATRVGRAAFTFDCAAASFSTAGNFNVDVRTAADQSILYCTQSATDPYTLDIYNTAPAGGSATPALSFPSALIGGTFTRVELRFWLSTETLGALELDGVWQCYVNGAYAGGQAGVKVGVAGTGWGKVGFSPMGAGSDVLISDDLPNLLTNLALVGVPGGFSTPLATWQADGTVNGVITLPLDGTFDLGAVAVSRPDNRIYVVQHPHSGTGCVLRVYNQFGTLVAATPIDDGGGPYDSYCIYVPQSGALWVSVEVDTATGQVWEYNADGVFQSVIATLGDGGGYMEAAYGMARIGTFLYFSSLSDTDGVYKYDLSGGGLATLVLAGRVNGLAATPSNELLITARLSGDGVERINTTGTVLQTYTVTSALGIASAGAGAAWVGGNDLITNLDLTTGTGTTFTSKVGLPFEVAACESALAAPLPAAIRLFTILPGPLDNDPSFYFMPDGDSPYGVGTGNPTYVGSVLALTTGSPNRTIAVSAIVPATPNPTVSICGAVGGGWWQATDNSGITTLFKYRANGTVDRTVDCAVLLGNTPGTIYNRRDLMALATGNLLGIVRATGVVVEISGLDGAIVKSYGLTITSALGLDGAVNADGTRLVYLDVTNMGTGPTRVRAWSLTDDTDAGVIVSDDALYAWSLVWLADCSLAFMVNTGASMTPARRYRMDGTLLGTFAYDEAAYPASEETYGIIASVAEDRLVMFRDWDEGMQSEQPAGLPFKLSTTGICGPQVPVVGVPFDYDGLSALGMPYLAIMCTPFPPTPPAPQFIPIRREIEFPLLPDGDVNQRKYVSRFQVIVQAGIGLAGTGPGSDPHFAVQFSDGGKVWGPILTMAVGKQGDYGLPVYLNRIGYAYDPRAKLITSDPVDWQIVKCTVDVELDESVAT